MRLAVRSRKHLQGQVGCRGSMGKGILFSAGCLPGDRELGGTGRPEVTTQRTAVSSPAPPAWGPPLIGQRTSSTHVSNWRLCPRLPELGPGTRPTTALPPPGLGVPAGQSRIPSFSPAQPGLQPQPSRSLTYRLSLPQKSYLWALVALNPRVGSPQGSSSQCGY